MHADDMIQKIMGKKPNKNFSCDNAFQKPINGKGLGQGLGFGKGMGPIGNQMGMSHKMNIDPWKDNNNSNNVPGEIKKALDKMPDVQRVSGRLNINFKNGKSATVDITYNE